jgi:cell division septum initiation protein DivIVA
MGNPGEVDAEKVQKDYNEALEENDRLKKQIAMVKEQIAQISKKKRG